MTRPGSCERAKGPVRYERFHDYDYSRGAVLFVTFALEERLPLLGRVAGDKVVLSPTGQAVAETIAREGRREGDVRLYQFVVMPDHVHVRLYVRPGARSALKAVGQFVANVKRWSKYRAAQVGAALIWQASFYDRLCVSREIIARVDKYIDNNPLKWSLMHGDKALMRVDEPLSASCLPLDEWWSGVGEKGLLAGRLAAFRLSRSIPPGEIPAVVARGVAAANKGFTVISTFISPAERALFEALVAGGAAAIRVVPDELAAVYRPKGDEPRLFAARRLLLLSRVAEPGTGRSAAWHGINDAIAEMALKTGGAAVYVVKGPRGVAWRFR